MADELLPEGIDALLGALAQALLNQAAAREARLLAEGRANLLTVSDGYHLSLRVPEKLYRRLGKDREKVREAEERIRRAAQKVLEPLMVEKTRPVKVSITAMLEPATNWREATKQQLTPHDPLGHRPHRLGTPPPVRDKPTTTEGFTIGAGVFGYDPERRRR